MSDRGPLARTIDSALDSLHRALESYEPEPRLAEVGEVEYLGEGIARVSGLPSVQADELVEFEDGTMGFALNLDPDEVGVVLLGRSEELSAGMEVRRLERLLDVPVGKGLLGRVIDPTGEVLDRGGRLDWEDRRQVERPAPSIMARSPVQRPLQTGIKAIDTLIPIGRGQRELILGDRQTGKTAIATDTIANQLDRNVMCVYCAVGQRTSAVAKVTDDLDRLGALDYTVIMVAEAEDPPGLQFIAPYAATAVAEYFMDHGQDALVIYDDLTVHARAYRELSLLLRRPPGREAYPGDIFYIHSRLLERSAQLGSDEGGGSLTALPIIETEAQNLSAYIPTNLISITDGQIYLSPDLMQKGNLPAVDVGTSVSRVGGKAQLPAYKLVAGQVRLAYSQFEELESFARFGTRLDEETRQSLARGRRVREVLKQDQFSPRTPAQQVVTFLAVNNGLFDDLELEQVGRGEEIVHELLEDELADLRDKIEDGQELTDDDRDRLLETIDQALEDELGEEEGSDGDA
ncbi:MAG: alternate F1F0 ATPase, F1 subunit alpha [Armatimonadia bacterium]|nr:alternate F1F0 ATPase, F1 subunit alpha [Armatimonadia bacterium]